MNSTDLIEKYLNLKKLVVLSEEYVKLLNEILELVESDEQFALLINEIDNPLLEKQILSIKDEVINNKKQEVSQENILKNLLNFQ